MSRDAQNNLLTTQRLEKMERATAHEVCLSTWRIDTTLLTTEQYDRLFEKRVIIR